MWKRKICKFPINHNQINYLVSSSFECRLRIFIINTCGDIGSDVPKITQKEPLLKKLEFLFVLGK